MVAITATDARRNFFDLIKGATKKHKIFRVSHREGSAVLLSEEDYDSLIETLELLSIPDFREKLRKSVKQAQKGETYTLEEVFGK